MASIYTGFPIMKRLAVTGGMTLTGAMAVISGLAGKLEAASRLGNTKNPVTVVIPADNIRSGAVVDIGDDGSPFELQIHSSSRRRLRIYAAENLWDLLGLALVPNGLPSK